MPLCSGGGGTAELKGFTSKVAVGDILLIPAKQTVTVDSLLDMLIFFCARGIS
ncbi:MAG: hypothetical protein HC912_07320 [Saprospiraceae bacterium]|nr:hypothetical protein [Saprospiraceae bacterium]